MIYTKSKQIKANYAYYTKGTDWQGHKLTDNLYDYYQSPSYNKVRSFHFWREFVNELNGRDIKILSAGCQNYSFGFLFTKENEDYFCWVTKDYTRYCKVSELNLA